MSAAEEPAQLGRAMVRGSAWMIASRWVLRLIGLVSTVVLARVLTPADFGLVAMAMLIVSGLEVLGETGQRLALIRLPAPTREHYDTAWTFSVIIGCSVALALAVAAPVAATLFEEPRVSSILWCLALRPLMGGFQNIGLVDLQRQLDFRRDQQVILIAKLVSFALTLTLALALRSYWALIAGTLANGLVVLVLSYTYSPFRPRLSLAKSRELWSFSIWTLVTHITQYCADRGDQAVIARQLDAQSMGAYVVGGELAAMPTEELVGPPARALYAVYSRVSEDLPALRAHYLNALSFIAVIACASSTGLALVAGDAVRVVLGDKWLAAIPPMPWLALSAGVLGTARSAITVLLAAGHARANALRGIAFACMLVPATALGVAAKGLEGAAIARFAVTLTIAPIMFFMLMRLIDMPLSGLVAALWRPLGAAALMAAVVLSAQPHMPDVSLVRLPLTAGLGALTYVATLGLLWLASGRPAGAERLVVTTVTRFRRPSGL